MILSADLGPWSAPADELQTNDHWSLHKASPSRLRRRWRRANERERIATDEAAAERIAAEKAAVEKVDAEKAATERTAAENAAAEKVEAEKAAAERTAAEKAAAEKVEAEKAAAEKFDAEKAAAESAAKAENTVATAEIKSCDNEVSTSSCGKEPAKTCWNCDKEMTFDHQCDAPPVPVPVGSKPSPALPFPVSPAPYSPPVSAATRMSGRIIRPMKFRDTDYD